jgi:hypothetical protein
MDNILIILLLFLLWKGGGDIWKSVAILVIVYCCFIVSQIELKFLLQQHGNGYLNMYSGFYVIISFSQFILIMQIGHILMKDCIKFFYTETAEKN